MTVDTETLGEIYHVAQRAVDRAAEVIISAREGGAFDVDFKGARDLVTSADLAAEAAILQVIRDKFPDHGILSEETFPTISDTLVRGPLWIVDPIDGTTNFAQGHHQVAVSVAFAFEGKVLVGVVDAPFQRERFAAQRGVGATLNGQGIKARETSTLEQALVATGFPYERNDVYVLVERLRRILSSCRDIRRIGSAALDLCWVACGRFDAYYETVKPWDMAAGALIAREAGAVVGRLDEAQLNEVLPPELSGDNMLVCTPLLYESLMRLLCLESPRLD